MEICDKFDTLRVHIEYETGDIIIDKCCIKQHDKDCFIKRYSIDDFLKIKDVYQELDSLKNHFPSTYNTSISLGCPSNMTICDFHEYTCEKLTGVDLSIDTHCNSHCTFCHVFEQNKEFQSILPSQKKAYFKLLNDLKGHNLKKIRLTDAGEPFFWKKETLDYILSLESEKDCYVIDFTTNFTTLNENEVKELCEKSKVELAPIISLNAWDNESYTKIMGTNFFNQVIENIKVLKEHLHNSCGFFVSFIVDDTSSVYNIYKFILNNESIFDKVIIKANIEKPELQPEIEKYFIWKNYYSIPRKTLIINE